MSTMEIGFFTNILNSDEKIRNPAVQAIQAAQSDPSFVGFLLNAIQSPQSKENKILLNALLITLVDTARRHPDHIITATRSPEVKELLINLLFSIPLECRPHIEECLLIVAPAAADEFTAIFQAIFSSVNQTSNIADIYTTISFSNKWIKMSQSTSFMTNFCQVILPFLQTCISSSDEIHTNTVSELSKLARNLISRRHIILDSSLDDIIRIFISVLIQPLQTVNGLQMKANVVKMFNKLILAVYENWKSVSEIEEWRLHFVNNCVPMIYQSALQLAQQPMDHNLSCQLFYQYYLFVSFEVNPQQILTPEFFKNLVIPAARLYGNDLIDYQSNPNQYISFCCEHSNTGYFSSRVCASGLISIVIQKYLQYFDPLPLIAQNTSTDPIDFEARIFLLQRYSMEADLPADVFETYFNLLTTDQPVYIVSALIRMVTVPMSKKDAVVGISVAEHFIINADDPIVQYSACVLMLSCLADFDGHLEALNGIIDLNTAELFPALIKLSNLIRLQEPILLTEKIFKIGPTNFMNIVYELVMRFFQLWRENQSGLVHDSSATSTDQNNNIDNIIVDDAQPLVVGFSILNSITTILESVPANSELIISLAPIVLEQLAADMAEFPNSSSFSDQLRVAAVFSRKITDFLEVHVTFIRCVIDILSLQSTTFNPCEIIVHFSMLICPLISNPNFRFFDNLGFAVPFILRLCDSVLSPDADSDEESISNALICAAVLIQTGGAPYFPFVTTASQCLINRQRIGSGRKHEILYGALYVFAAALFVDAAQTQLLLVSELPDVVCEMLCGNRCPVAYREMKVALFVLTCFAKFGHEQSFKVAESLVMPLLDMKALDDECTSLTTTMTNSNVNTSGNVGVNSSASSGIEGIKMDKLMERAKMHEREELYSIAPLIPMPIDELDELQNFMDFSQMKGMQNILEHNH